MKKTPLTFIALGMFCCLALSVSAVDAAEPFPVEHCIAQDAPPVALGVSMAYGLVLGERMQNDEMSQDEFLEALTDFQNVTRLMLVENDPDAACLLIANLEDQYNLPRPDLDALPGDQPIFSEEE